jgi:outer membrane protein TolC
MAARTAALEAAQSMATSAGRLPDPSVILGIDNLPVDGPDSFSTTSDFMTMRKVGLMQVFPAGARRRSERDVASADITLAQAQLEVSRFDVARETALAWIRYAATLDALERVRILEPQVQLGADAARAALGAGRGSSADALAAEAAVTQLKSRLLRLHGDARRSEAELARWIGEEAIAPPAAMPSMDELPVAVTQLREAVHSHVGILPLDAQVQRAEADLELARAARHPGWSAELTFSKRGPDFSDMASLQFAVDLPLFFRNRQNPIIDARSADLRRVRAERDVQLQMHGAELQQMLISWQQAGEELKFYESEQLPLAHERSSAALAAYRSGQTEVRSVLEALADETELLVERANLQAERGAAWTYLRYLARSAQP